jgi:hypothetical protein
MPSIHAAPGHRPRASLSFRIAIVAIAAAGALAACGGSSSSVEAAYVVPEYLPMVNAGRYHFVLVDPAHPQAPLRDEAINDAPMQGFTDPAPALVPETTWSSASGTVHLVGYPRAYHVQQNLMWTLDLRGGHDHASKQVAGVDRVTGVLTLGAGARDGSDVWVRVDRLDATRNGYTTVMHVQAETTLLTLTDPVQDLVALEDETGLFAGVVAHRAGVGGLETVFLGRGAAAWQSLGLAPPSGRPHVAQRAGVAGAGELVLADGLHHVTWSDTAMTVGPLRHALSGGTTQLVADAGGTWLVEGTTVVRVADDGTATTVVLGAPDRTPIALRPFGGDLLAVLWQDADVLGPAPSVPDGDVIDVVESDLSMRSLTAPGEPVRPLDLLGTRGDQVLLRTGTIVSNAMGWYWSEGAAVWSRATGARTPTSAKVVVVEPDRIPGAGSEADLAATIGCADDLPGLDCTGNARQIEFATGATSLSQALTVSTFAPAWSIGHDRKEPLRRGVPASVSLCGPVANSYGDGCDLYLITPGTNAPWVRLTHYIP